MNNTRIYRHVTGLFVRISTMAIDQGTRLVGANVEIILAGHHFAQPFAHMQELEPAELTADEACDRNRELIDQEYGGDWREIFPRWPKAQEQFVCASCGVQAWRWRFSEVTLCSPCKRAAWRPWRSQEEDTDTDPPGGLQEQQRFDNPVK